MRVRSARGSVLPMALMITFIMLVVGFALAVLGTSNLNLASYEANRQKALELARAGLNQYLYDLDNRPANRQPVVLTNVAKYSMDLTRISLPAIPPQRVPYPMPDSHLEGTCYITFNRDLPYYSVDNTTSTTAADGWKGPGTVPPYCLQLIATAIVNGFEKHVEVLVSKRWDYALSTPCPIDITGTAVNGQYIPSVIQGDVFTEAQYTAGNDPVINVGRRRESGDWVSSKNNTIHGYLRVSSKNRQSVYVDVENDNSVAGTKFGSTEKVYPSIDLPSSAAWTDLASEYTQARSGEHNGAWLSSYVDSAGQTCYAIETDGSAGTTEFVLPAGTYQLNGNLVGSTSSGTASTATDLVLDGATLKVNGKVEFSNHPKRLYGNEAVLWVSGALKFHDGFIDGGDNGLVLYAKSVDTKAGGSLKGLVLVEDELKMEAFDKELQAADAATFDTLRAKSDSRLYTNSLVRAGSRRVAGMYVQGGVFTPYERTINWIALLFGIQKRFSFRSVNLTWEPAYLKALHKFADLKICYWQEIP